MSARLPPPAGEVESDGDRIRVAVIGRPNVGKSTLVNRLVGEERVLAHDAPGTTRDSIDVPFSRDGTDFLLVDTAGIRRRARSGEPLERVSVIKSLQAIASSQVVVLVVDARGEIAEQDLSLLGEVLDEGRACVIAVNKWDGLDGERRARIKSVLQRRLVFAEYLPVCFISALHGGGLGELLAAVQRVWSAARAKCSTAKLTRVLARAVADSPPPTVRGRRIKLRYAHQGGSNPPTVVIHGNQTEALPAHYRRYLARCFREALDLYGTPLRVELRTGENPFAGRRNELTPRQKRRRKRLLRHVRR